MGGWVWYVWKVIAMDCTTDICIVEGGCCLFLWMVCELNWERVDYNILFEGGVWESGRNISWEG